MKINPFNSQTYIDTWSKHFNNSKNGVSFNFIDYVSFVKHKFLPYYVNIGKNLTNGIQYVISDHNALDYKNKVFLIRDIPSYYNIPGFKRRGSLKLKKIFQYEGYITRISEYENLEAYLKTIYKSNSRSKLRRNVSRLEASFDVEYVMYHGDISTEQFQIAFDAFYNLLEKRYANKQEPCGELNPVIWNYYTELAFKMIQEKTASLFVIYCNKKPIGVTFSYHFGSTLIEALTVFDIDFYRYNIGHTTILKMLEWSFDNHIQIFDYTQGDFEYKKRWSDDTYKTHYHLFYDSKSILSVLIANFIESYFNFKRAFREKNYNKIYHQLKYKILGKNKAEPIVVDTYNVEIIKENIPNKENLERLDLEDFEMLSIRRAIYDFLYMNPQPAISLELYKPSGNSHYFYAFGKLNTLIITKNES
ncbi:GNAT family N-acetyltransferase [Xanthomarina sp. GH4-25]|uniref:GNAT family N-acetyltransferase n=1 Tax=Xanthomarina sp. GH4-25 TaxID=3349335 RepID=UPI000D67C6A1|nr:GNAT family N-acetyltransferase [Flavobacteriaceae bacterium LYZ1037]